MVRTGLGSGGLFPAVPLPPGGPGRPPGTLPEARGELRLLGNFGLLLADGSMSLSVSAQRLLALLALRGTQRRVFVAGMLWPEVREEQALTRLRSTLWRLRRLGPKVVVADELNVGLHPDVGVDADIMTSAARAVMNHEIDPSGLTAGFWWLVHSEDLLVGWYEDWVIDERERLGQLRIHGLELLVDELLEAGRYAEALEAASTAVRLDPLRESTHRSVMRVYLAENNPASARRQVERYRHILRTQLGAQEPTRAMLALLEGPAIQGAVVDTGSTPR